MKEKRITIALSDSLVERIDGRGYSRPETIEKDLTFLYNLELFTLLELKDIFTDVEIVFLATNCVCGLGMYPAASPKDSLLGNIETSVDARQLYSDIRDFMTEKDIPRLKKDIKEFEKIRLSLLQKVEKLTSFQCYCIHRLIQMTFDQAPGGKIHQDQLIKLFNTKKG